MEKWLRALERRFGRFAPGNVAAVLIAPQAAVFIAYQLQGDASGSRSGILGQLLFAPALVLEGEAWRLITFLFVPPTLSPIWFLFYALVLYIYCSGLQARWGPVRLIIYIFIGWFATVAASFIAYLLDPSFILDEGFIAVETTLLFALATYYPDFEFRVLFILPVKVKWLAWLAAGYGALLFSNGPWDELAAYADRVVILGAVGNYLLFFGPALWASLRDRRVAVDRRRQFEEAMRRGHEERDRLAAEDEEREGR